MILPSGSRGPMAPGGQAWRLEDIANNDGVRELAICHLMRGILLIAQQDILEHLLVDDFQALVVDVDGTPVAQLAQEP